MTKKGRLFLIIAVLLVVVAMPKIVRQFVPKRTDPIVTVLAFLGNEENPGRVVFTGYNWKGYRQIIFSDYGFDGTIDKVVYRRKDEEKLTEINLSHPDPRITIWAPHYREIRKEASKIRTQGPTET